MPKNQKKKAIVKKLKPTIREEDLPPISPEHDRFLNLIATLIVNVTIREVEAQHSSTLPGVVKDKLIE